MPQHAHTTCEEFAVFVWIKWATTLRPCDVWRQHTQLPNLIGWTLTMFLQPFFKWPTSKLWFLQGIENDKTISHLSYFFHTAQWWKSVVKIRTGTRSNKRPKMANIFQMMKMRPVWHYWCRASRIRGNEMILNSIVYSRFTVADLLKNWFWLTMNIMNRSNDRAWLSGGTVTSQLLACAVFNRLFDRLPARILTSDFHHRTSWQEIYQIRDDGVALKIAHLSQQPQPTRASSPCIAHRQGTGLGKAPLSTNGYAHESWTSWRPCLGESYPFPIPFLSLSLSLSLSLCLSIFPTLSPLKQRLLSLGRRDTMPIEKWA